MPLIPNNPNERMAAVYAETMWTKHDVQTLREGWSLDKCEDWLIANERRIQDRLIEAGWGVIEDLLSQGG